jgi:hypothetical protein
MNLSKDDILKIAQCLFPSKHYCRPSLDELQTILGLEKMSYGRDDYELDGHFAFAPDPRSFDPEKIEGLLDPALFKELSRRKKPNRKELELWIAKWKSEVFTDDSGWFHFYIWKIDLPNFSIYFRSLHGDGGYHDHFDGPFESVSDALADAGALDIIQH